MQDVLAATHCLRMGFPDVFDDVEILALYIGALGHDAGHFRFNNAFLKNSKHTLFRKYPDSVLENFHLGLVFELVDDPEVGIATHLDETQLTRFKELVTNLILATDMSKHRLLVDRFKEWCQRSKEEHAQRRRDAMLHDTLGSDLGSPADLWYPWFRGGGVERTCTATSAQSHGRAGRAPDGTPTGPGVTRRALLTNSVPTGSAEAPPAGPLPPDQGCAYALHRPRVFSPGTQARTAARRFLAEREGRVLPSSAPSPERPPAATAMSPGPSRSRYSSQVCTNGREHAARQGAIRARVSWTRRRNCFKGGREKPSGDAPPRKSSPKGMRNPYT